MIKTENLVYSLIIIFAISFVVLAFLSDWRLPEQTLVDDSTPVLIDTPTCETIIRTSNECGLIEVDEEYQEKVCKVRNYRYLTSDQNHWHYENSRKTKCYTEFSIDVKNIEVYSGKFRVDFNLFDNDIEFFETLSDEQTLDWNEQREFVERYEYHCGQSRINNYIVSVIAPQREFCENETFTKKVPKYVCNDVNFEIEVCDQNL